MTYLKIAFYLFAIVSLSEGFVASFNQRTLSPRLPLWVHLGQTSAAVYFLVWVIWKTLYLS